jgi:hypothetical protein
MENPVSGTLGRNLGQDPWAEDLGKGTWEDAYCDAPAWALQGMMLAKRRMPDRLKSLAVQLDGKQAPKKVRPRSDAATDGDRWGA